MIYAIFKACVDFYFVEMLWPAGIDPLYMFARAEMLCTADFNPLSIRYLHACAEMLCTADFHPLYVC